MKRARLIVRILALAIVLLTPVAVAQPRYQRDLDAGVAKLKSAEFEVALTAFLRAAQAAAAAGDSKGQADAYFYSGLTLQQEAETLAVGDRREETLGKAATYYERSLRLRPESASALNNLARIYSARGEKEKAANLYQQAIDQGGDRAAAYAKNYAAQLEETDGWTAAAIYYRKALEIHPDDAEAHRSLVQLYVDNGSPEIVDYLWQALTEQQVQLVREGALIAFDSRSFQDSVRGEFLHMIVATMTAETYLPLRFSETEIGKRLERYREDPEFEAAITELFELHRALSLNRQDYSWWARRVDWNDENPSGVEVFGRLVRSLGDRYRRAATAGALAVAESYYRLAVSLNERAVDPKALLELADIYFETGRLSEVHRLSKEFESRLFQAKGKAYGRGDWNAIYDYHRTLGVIYSRLGQLGDQSTADSAIFQLEHARNAASELEALNLDGDSVILETGLIEMLASAYEAENQDEKALGVRLDAAEGYIRAGRVDDAGRVIQGLGAPETTERNTVRYREVLQEIKARGSNVRPKE